MSRLLQINVSPEAAKIFQLFSSIFGIRIVFTTAEPREVEVIGEWKGSRFCNLMNHKLGTNAACIALDEKKRREAAAKRTMISYRCHAGLLECIIPVHFDRSLIGFFVIGQIRTSNEIHTPVRAAWAKKFEMPELEAAFGQLPFVAPEKVKDMLDLFALLVRYILSQHMISLRGDVALGEMLDFLSAHISEGNLSIGRMAKYSGKSPSTISHLFRKRLGKSFKQVLIEERLRKFEEYSIKNPELTVKAAAETVGFSDPYYFSRIYKKYRGKPPTAFRRERQEADNP